MTAAMELIRPDAAWLAHPVVLVVTSVLWLVAGVWLAVLRPVLFNGGKFPSVPGSNWLLGHLLHFADVSKFQDVIDDWCEKHGMAEYRLTNQRFLLITDPAEMMKLNRMRPQKIQRYHLVNETVDFAAPGVFSAEGRAWGVERRMISPAFSHANISNYIPTIRKIGARLATVLSEDGAKGAAPVDALGTLQHFAADVISDLGFGHETNILTKRSDETLMVAQLMKVAGSRPFSPVPFWRFPIIGPYLDGGGFMRDRLNASMAEVVTAAKAKRQSNGPGTTILDKLIDWSENEGGAVSDLRLAGNVNTLFAAGSDTAATTITWMLYDLARDPELQEEARAEAAAADISDTSTFADVMTKLPVLRSLFQEELRLRGPAGHVMVQNRDVPVEVAGRICEPGEYVFVWPIRWLNTQPDVCSDPKTFIARRWLSEDGKSVKAMPPQVAPFGGGPRACPGKDFSVVESLVCVADMLHEFRIEMRDTKEIVPNSKFTMQPSESVMLHFHPRETG